MTTKPNLFIKNSSVNSDGFSIIELFFVIVVICIIAAAGYLTYKHYAHKTSVSNVTTTKTTNDLAPPIVPQNHAYLGAFVNPEHVGSGNSESGSNVINQLSTFNQSIGGKVDIIHFYTQMKAPVPTTTLSAIESNGSIPLISWGCADVNAISSGQYDSTINNFAAGLKAFGKPVFLRWYWEMNQMNKNGDTPAGSGCNGYNNGPAYISAWQHIYNIFQSVGAKNVGFVWSPGYSGGNFSTYYPGDKYVDWIGLDRYERTDNGQPLLSFSDMYSSYYNEWSSHGKPIMIAETAAMGESDQTQYINSIAAQAPTYPLIKALVWFDSTGPAGNWALSGNGAKSFGSLAASNYFAN